MTAFQNNNDGKKWGIAAIVWIALICFSSTSLAWMWCEKTFKVVSGFLFARVRLHLTSDGLVHLLADKGLHVALFIVLANLLWRAFPDRRRKAINILLVGLIIGAFSEFLQLFVPGRDPAIRDVLINFGGTVAGVMLNFIPIERPRGNLYSLR